MLTGKIAKAIEEEMENGDHSLKTLNEEELGEDHIYHFPLVHYYRFFNNYGVQKRLDAVRNTAPNPEEVDDAIWEIVDTYLMPRNIGNATEEERLFLIEQGLQEADKLAGTLEGDLSRLLKEAMNKIADIGRKGTVGKDGEMTYYVDPEIPGMPKNMVKPMDRMRETDPELAQYIEELEKKSGRLWFEGKEEESHRLMFESARLFVSWWRKMEQGPEAMARKTHMLEACEDAEKQADEAEEQEKEMQKKKLVSEQVNVQQTNSQYTKAIMGQQLKYQQTKSLMDSLKNMSK